jgi:hypothetical protein
MEAIAYSCARFGIGALPAWPEIDAIKELLGKSPSQLRQSQGTGLTGEIAGRRAMMNEDVFNTSIRTFLKTLGVTAQREIEKSVRQALADGRLKGSEKLAAKAVVTIGALSFTHEIAGEIKLA